MKQRSSNNRAPYNTNTACRLEFLVSPSTGRNRAENNDHPHRRDYTFDPSSRGDTSSVLLEIRASFPITKLDQTNKGDIRPSIRLTSLDTAR